MARETQSVKHDGQEYKVRYDEEPNKCPFCHHKVEPKTYSSYFNDRLMEMVFRCPNSECQRIFIGTYTFQNGLFHLQETSVGTHEPRDFSDNIKEVSSSFVEIYNQALAGEHHKLEQISGIGYRKAFEFLVKDYLISKFPNKEQEIKNKFLGRCIKEDVKSPNLRDIAERAAWLGNDETHYNRKWKTKDVHDLKKLIDLAVHWIEMELLTEQYKKEMG